MKLHEQIAKYYPQYHDIQRYPADKCACIGKVKDEWGVFGNFYPAELVVNGVKIDCSERLFHLLKFLPTAKEGVQEELAVQKGMAIKMHMKRLYKTHPEWLRDEENWGSMVVDAMKFCLMTKYQQCELFRQELERSKGLYIVEMAHKAGKADSWSAALEGDEYVGPSLLGRLLMELRDNGNLEYHLPKDALDFLK